MVGDPVIRVWCDVCKDEEEVEMTPLARGSFDDRNVVRGLRGRGWDCDDDGSRTICPECVKAEKKD